MKHSQHATQSTSLCRPNGFIYSWVGPQNYFTLRLIKLMLISEQQILLELQALRQLASINRSVCNLTRLPSSKIHQDSSPLFLCNTLYKQKQGGGKGEVGRQQSFTSASWRVFLPRAFLVPGLFRINKTSAQSLGNCLSGPGAE